MWAPTHAIVSQCGPSLMPLCPSINPHSYPHVPVCSLTHALLMIQSCTLQFELVGYILELRIASQMFWSITLLVHNSAHLLTGITIHFLNSAHLLTGTTIHFHNSAHLLSDITLLFHNSAHLLTGTTILFHNSAHLLTGINILLHNSAYLLTGITEGLVRQGTRQIPHLLTGITEGLVRPGTRQQPPSIDRYYFTFWQQCPSNDRYYYTYSHHCPSNDGITEWLVRPGTRFNAALHLSCCCLCTAHLRRIRPSSTNGFFICYTL